MRLLYQNNESGHRIEESRGHVGGVQDPRLGPTHFSMSVNGITIFHLW